jgi:predicted AAA+ superfamily ATPase
MYFLRRLKKPTRCFFLLGPRATGKSTWLEANFVDPVLRIDLLRNDVYFPLMADPSIFRQRVLAKDPKSTWIIVDEIQRIPVLLNDIHSLIESEGYQFALSGSSVRKLKRGNANLLAGRALVKHMYPLTYAEYGSEITLDEALAFGTLPGIVTDPDFRIDRLEAYVDTYLREEIKEEALTRNVQAFSRFLEVAALSNGQITNLSNLSRDAAVARTTISSYFEILTDTLLGSWLPAWTPRAKVKEIAHPKFYFFDCGVVRTIQKLLRDPVHSMERGILFETMIFNELNAHIAYQDIGGELSYWRTSDGIEIDFIWNRGATTVAIEVKSGTQWKKEYNRGIKSLLLSPIKPTACYAIYCGQDILKQDWGFVLPWREFLNQLYQGKIIG